MDANGAVALSTTVDHHDVVNLIYGLIFGLSIAIVYIAVFLFKQKQSFRSGTVAYVMFEATACYGVVGILWRILNFEYVGRLGAEEHIYIDDRLRHDSGRAHKEDHPYISQRVWAPLCWLVAKCRRQLMEPAIYDSAMTSGHSVNYPLRRNYQSMSAKTFL